MKLNNIFGDDALQKLNRPERRSKNYFHGGESAKGVCCSYLARTYALLGTIVSPVTTICASEYFNNNKTIINGDNF